MEPKWNVPWCYSRPILISSVSQQEVVTENLTDCFYGIALSYILAYAQYTHTWLFVWNVKLEHCCNRTSLSSSQSDREQVFLLFYCFLDALLSVLLSAYYSPQNFEPLTTATKREWSEQWNRHAGIYTAYS